MAVGPLDPQGVIPHELQVSDRDLGIDALDINDPLAGGLIHTQRAHALRTQRHQIQLPHQPVRPFNREGPFLGNSADCSRWQGTFHLEDSSRVGPVVASGEWSAEQRQDRQSGEACDDRIVVAEAIPIVPSRDGT